MIVSSFNVRGLSGRLKKKKIKVLIHNSMVDFMAIQKSKLELVMNHLYCSLWGSDDYLWAFLPLEGNN